MVFLKKLWENRNVEFPNRRTLTNVNTGEVSTVDVERMEGAIYTDGDPFSAATMNKLEDRIEAGFNDVSDDMTKLDTKLTNYANTLNTNQTNYTNTQVSALRTNVNSLDAQNVKISGNQTIAGVKTFSSPPVSATNPTANNQTANKSYVDSQVSNANTNATTAVTNAKVFKKTASVTSSGWASGNGYYQKTTGQTLPSGYDSQIIGINILDDASAVNLSQSVFIRAVNVNGTVFVRTGVVPNGTINIGLAFVQVRTS